MHAAKEVRDRPRSSRGSGIFCGGRTEGSSTFLPTTTMPSSDGKFKRQF